MTMLRVESVSKRFGAVQAVENVSLEVAPGEVFGLLGANGAGKTTLVDCILGLTRTDAGTVTINGAAAGSLAARAVTGAVLQTTGLPAAITPREALVAFGAFYRSPLVDTLLARFGLNEKQNAAHDTLSRGQKQRLALALAMLGDPALLVLDEPGAGLDPAMRRDWQAMLRSLKDRRRAIMLTTHDIAEARALCDRVAVMAAGRIIATGAPADLALETLLGAQKLEMGA